jgi:hypothetical protein
VAVAVRFFESATGQVAHAGLCSVIGDEAGGVVVRVCYCKVKPPRRVWYRVGEDGLVAELSFEDVSRFGESLWW